MFVTVFLPFLNLLDGDGGTLADDPAFTAQIADIDLQVQALEMSELRVLSTMAQGGAPGPEVSTLKVRGSEIQQRIIANNLLGKSELERIIAERAFDQQYKGKGASA